MGMRARFAVLCAVCLLAGAALAADPVVTVDTGQLRGDADGDIDVFKNVPFAAPPVGDLRWRAPQPPAAWQGVRDARKLGPRCPQVDSFSTYAPGPMREDCLYLNIWAPRGGDKLPVMVWIHGGGYSAGSGTMKLYDGKALARRGVIIVTINYRIGRLGFFAHPALKAERDADYPAEPMGLYGIMDQIAALQWVQRNITAFGGDAGNVTVFGESAGGGAISMLMVSPRAKGLFHRAISQSGGGIASGRDNHIAIDLPERPSAMLLGQAFAHNQGLPPTVSAKALRALPVDKLIGRQMGGMGWPFVDGEIVPDSVPKMFAEGRQHALPFLLGANSLEGAMGRTGDDVLERIAPDVPADQLRALYGDKSELWIAQQWMGDSRALAGAKYQAMNMARVAAPAYLYYMSYVTRSQRADYQGVRHGDELPYVFLALRKFESGAAAPDYRVSSMMATYWTNFAKTGDPNTGDPEAEDLPPEASAKGGLPRWAPYTADADTWFEIGDTIGMKPGLLAARLDFHIARFKQRAGLP